MIIHLPMRNAEVLPDVDAHEDVVVENRDGFRLPTV